MMNLSSQVWTRVNCQLSENSRLAEGEGQVREGMEGRWEADKASRNFAVHSTCG